MLVVFFAFISKYYFFSIYLFVDLLLVVLITIFVRAIYFKPRPNKMAYNNFLEKLDASSFPSIHSARITSLFLSYILYFKANLFLSVFLFLIAFLIFYSRVYLKKHDWIDVSAGFMLGSAVSFGIFLFLNLFFLI